MRARTRRSGAARCERRPPGPGPWPHSQRSGARLDRPAPSVMKGNPWFESVAEAQRRAKRRLPKPVYSALLAGSEAGVTYRDNMTAFGELGFAPHVGGRLAQRELATR